MAFATKPPLDPSEARRLVPAERDANLPVVPMHDLTAFIAHARASVAAHAGPRPGQYRRWLRQNAAGNRDLDPTLYGAVDAAHILYTLGELPGEGAERAAWLAELRRNQDPATGLFADAQHHTIHATAFTVGALELFDARPQHPLHGLAPHATRDGLRTLLDSLDWTHQPWAESHRGAGIYGAMVLAGSVPPEWSDWYFEWLWENQDPATGLWRRGCICDKSGGLRGAPLFHHLASSFHYLFNHDHARRALRHTEPLVDFCHELHRTGQLPPMGRGLSWNEIDFLYTLRSLQKRTPYRSAESRAVIEEIAEKLVASVLRIEPATDEGLNDLHTLFAGICSLAVVQEALPGFLRTHKPLRLVLDRRPFL